MGFQALFKWGQSTPETGDSLEEQTSVSKSGALFELKDLSSQSTPSLPSSNPSNVSRQVPITIGNTPIDGIPYGSTPPTDATISSTNPYSAVFTNDATTDIFANDLQTPNEVQKTLTKRQLQMIAIGGSIGTGLFVGTGTALHNGGPASILIAWLLIGTMMYCTVHALGELAVAFPLNGAFSVYSTRFINPSWGFAMGWNYALQWLISLPTELVACTLVMNHWKELQFLHPALWITIFYFVIVSISAVGVRAYAEAEFVFACFKIITIFVFVILGTVIAAGGVPSSGYSTHTYWSDPGCFANGFKGFVSVLVIAAFSFSGTEMCGLAAAEAKDPAKSLPSATKQVFWRIFLFYISTLIIIGLLIPYNEPRLVPLNGTFSTSSSPFVIAIENAGIQVIPHLINAVILLAILSVGISAVYGCSRTLLALSEQGQAPKFLCIIDDKGRPIWATVACCSSGLLAYISCLPGGAEILSWLMALGGLSAIITWGSICLSHIRFRRGLAAQGRGTDELTFKSQVGVIGSYFGLICNVLILVAQFWVAVSPIAGKASPASFFKIYLAVPVIALFFVVHFIMKNKNNRLFIKPTEIDLDSGRRETDLELLRSKVLLMEQAMKAKPWYARVYHAMF